jgi:hypothetical protein
MGERNSPSVAHVSYDIYPLSWVEKYRNPRPTEGESIFPPVTVNRSIKTFPYNSHSNWYLFQR